MKFKNSKYCLTIPASDVKKDMINNYFQECIANYNRVYLTKIKYFICGYEVAKGEGGYKHWQCYIQLNKQARLSALHKMFPLGGKFHCEKQKGSNEEARNYCWKGQFEEEPTKYPQPSSCTFEWGVFCEGEGMNRPLHNIKKLIDDGLNHKEIVDSNEDYFKCYGKYHSWLYKYKHLVDESKYNRRRKPIETHCIVGDCAVGKTESIYNKYGDENVYKLDNPNGDNKNWNGYNGQKILIIDDFYSWIRMSDMMKILDNKPYRCRALGDYSLARWEKVYITSNKSPDLWFPDVQNDKVKEAFYSRLTTCLEVHRGNTNKLYARFIDMGNVKRHSYNEYLDLNNYPEYNN